MINYNPDVLSCLANLSNDEVFTPPEIANRMLDMLPKDIWGNSRVKFLDPFCKSGVFLREITKRLLVGLAEEIPDVQERLDHILHHQVYGMAITELTALVSRRSLYCSKDASCEYSISHFPTAEGHVAFHEIQHTWNDAGKCVYCGASREVYERGEDRESHAYQFIHTDNPQELFDNMKFDVIIGNPPYQLSDGSGASTDAANPIYQLFVTQAMKLSPSYLIMIIPSKWMVGGKAVLNKFRTDFCNDNRVKYIYDYEDSAQCFAGLHIDGGVCFFLWQKQFNNKKVGGVHYMFHKSDNSVVESYRSLLTPHFKFVIRDERVLNILNKLNGSVCFNTIVSQTKPFGIRKDLFNNPTKYNGSGLCERPFENAITMYGVKGIKGGAKRIVGYVKRDFIKSNVEALGKYKLFFTTSYSTNATIPPETIKGLKDTACTETFLLIGPFEKREEMESCYSYINTNFFRFLLFHGKGTMQVNRDVFGLIPLVDFSHPWTDEQLYRKYNLSSDEITFIESMIRPMD